MEMIILLIKSLLLGWFITSFEPIEWVVEIIYEKNKKSKILPFIFLPLTCGKCCVFWTCLIMSHNIYLSITASILMIIFNKTIGRWLKEVTF